MTKILVATPAYGDVFYTPYVTSVVGLQRLLARHKWDMSLASIAYADIVESRNYLLTHWYDKTNATHLLFIDADMGYEPQAVLDMILLDRPVVGVIAPKRQIDLDRLAKLAAEGESPARARARAHDFIIRRNAKSGQADGKGFISVEACGTGILLIKRECITEMLRRMPDLSDSRIPRNSPFAGRIARFIRAFDPLKVNGDRLSEDFSFCHRWRQCGGEIWASTAHEITHIGLHRYAGRYSDTMAPGSGVARGTAVKLSASLAKLLEVRPVVAKRTVGRGAGPTPSIGRLAIKPTKK